MSESRFPAGWDEQRVKRFIQRYENLSEGEQVAEDDAAVSESPGQTVIAVPIGLLPAIRQLLADYDAGARPAQRTPEVPQFTAYST